MKLDLERLWMKTRRASTGPSVKNKIEKNEALMPDGARNFMARVVLKAEVHRGFRNVRSLRSVETFGGMWV